MSLLIQLPFQFLIVFFLRQASDVRKSNRVILSIKRTLSLL